MVAMFGGVRLTSMSSITVGDVMPLSRMPDGGYLLNIKLRFVKGMKTHHYLCFKGRAEESVDTYKDPVFWLIHYMRYAFRIDLVHPSIRNDALNEKLLWGWKGDAMRNNFKKLLAEHGYPNGMFTFHSLRRGSLANRLMLDQSGDTERSLKRQSVICGWTMQSQVRQRYITDTLQKIVVANDFSSNMISPGMTSVNKFHALDFSDDEAERWIE